MAVASLPAWSLKPLGGYAVTHLVNVGGVISLAAWCMVALTILLGDFGWMLGARLDGIRRWQDESIRA